VKKLGLIDKLIYLVNSIFAFGLLMSLLIPYIPPDSFPLLSVLSLVVSPLLLINVLFLLYWVLRVKRQMLMSLIVLLVCAVQFNAFYRIDFKSNPPLKENSLKVMNYNVRLFNLYEWIPDKTIPAQITAFIAEHDPDIISFQEYSSTDKVNLNAYPHKHVVLKKEKPSFGQAIYSKYPIVNSGDLNFKNSGNNAIYADVVKGTDTIRIYNVHLQSLQINESDIDFDQEASKRLIKRLSGSFKIQQIQAEMLEAHIKNSLHKTIVMADLNNTAFSYAYRKIKGNKKDAFAERGKGLGKTFVIKHIPLRIDFILTDRAFTVNEFYTHTQELSDHFAISSVLSWSSLE
jgi:vancomycin resistance protein VanJ